MFAPWLNPFQISFEQYVQLYTRTHARTHARTHTHTHMLGFHVLWGLSIDVMVFILYKLYILSPYTAPIPKPNHHRRHSAILHFQKTSLSLIYKLVSSWGPKNVPTRTRILDIAILVGTFCPHNVGFTWTTHTHTHTRTHTHTHTHTVFFLVLTFPVETSLFLLSKYPIVISQLWSVVLYLLMLIREHP